MAHEYYILDTIKSHCGFAHKPLDVGGSKYCPENLTIGYGFNLSKDFSRVVADYWLSVIFQKKILPELKKLFANFDKYSFNRQAALCSMCHQLGVDVIKGDADFVKFIRIEDWVAAANSEVFENKSLKKRLEIADMVLAG
jgi:hypothetical protein